MANKTIQTVILPSDQIDVNNVFRNYKYAVPEMNPVKLSNGMWLHCYALTNFNDCDPAGDIDVEQDCFDNEMYG